MTSWSPSQAAQELLLRLNAKNSLQSFISLVSPDTVPAKHHQLLLTHLEAIERGDISRLMIFMPPGSAKSTYASVLFPPWFLGRNDSRSVIGASHAGELAERLHGKDHPGRCCEGLTRSGYTGLVEKIAECLGSCRPRLPFPVASKVILYGSKFTRADGQFRLGFCIPEVKIRREKQQIVINVKEVETDTSI